MMFEEKFGILPKKKVTFDGHSITINKEAIPIHKVKTIYRRPYNFSANETGTLYFSMDGEDLTSFNPLNKQLIQFSKKQEVKINELINQLDIDVIEKPNFSSTLSSIPATKKNVVKCPNCKGTDLENLGNNKKSFSVGKAIGGAALTGGIGTLAGFAGKKGKSDKWHCKSCGQLFDK